jgi:hypothetical protein
VQAVAGEQVAIAQARLAHGEVGLRHLHSVEGAHEEGESRMGGRLLLGDATGVDKRLDVGVVMGYLAEVAIT